MPQGVQPDCRGLRAVPPLRLLPEAANRAPAGHANALLPGLGSTSAQRPSLPDRAPPLGRQRLLEQGDRGSTRPAAVLRRVNILSIFLKLVEIILFKGYLLFRFTVLLLMSK